jgi:hypothetical protein
MYNRKGGDKVHYRKCCDICHWFGINKKNKNLSCYVSGEQQSLNGNGNTAGTCPNFYDSLVAAEEGNCIRMPWEL